MPVGLLAYLFVCVTAGFAFGRLRFPFRLPIFLSVLFLMIFPQMLLSIQIFQICRALHLVNSYFGLILVWVAYFAPFGTYIMTTYYSTVPMEIIESARMDGASTWQLFFRIMIPIGMPMIAVIIIIGFQSMWNELPFSLLLLQKESLRTITQGIGMMKGQYGLDDTILTAGIMTLQQFQCFYLCSFRNTSLWVLIPEVLKVKHASYLNKWQFQKLYFYILMKF